jgi:hypothetical protein
MPKTTLKNPALGPYEAACLLGVHYTRIPRMAEQGVLRYRTLKSSTKTDRLRVYSWTDVEENWRDYEHLFRTGQLPRRPRANVDLRPGILREVLAIESHIEFDDAISAYEAAEIMGVWWTWPPRMVAAGVIAGRTLLSHREGPSRARIYSRRSCEENVQTARRMAREGPQIGRKRHAL